MRLLLLCLFVIPFTGCKQSREAVPLFPDSGISALTADQQAIYFEFKMIYFYYCLNYGYNYRRDRTFLGNDHSFMGDFPLGKYWMNKIDSLALLEREKISIDSAYYFDKIALKDEEYLGSKRVLRICLQGYNSPIIDSLAMLVAGLSSY